jgi:hypothetical protein
MAISTAGSRLANHPIRITNVPTTSRRNSPFQVSLLSIICRIGPYRSDNASTRPGSSATGSQDRGHHPASTTASRRRAGSTARGVTGGEETRIVAFASTVVGMGRPYGAI